MFDPPPQQTDLRTAHGIVVMVRPTFFFSQNPVTAKVNDNSARFRVTIGFGIKHHGSSLRREVGYILYIAIQMQGGNHIEKSTLSIIVV